MLSLAAALTIVLQVWNFSPPEETLIERSVSASLPQRDMDPSIAPRPLSAISLDYPRFTDSMQDVEMPDAGPSTAPLQRASRGFFPNEIPDGSSMN